MQLSHVFYRSSSMVQRMYLLWAIELTLSCPRQLASGKSHIMPYNNDICWYTPTTDGSIGRVSICCPSGHVLIAISDVFLWLVFVQCPCLLTGTPICKRPFQSSSPSSWKRASSKGFTKIGKICSQGSSGHMDHLACKRIACSLEVLSVSLRLYAQPLIGSKSNYPGRVFAW